MPRTALVAVLLICCHCSLRTADAVAADMRAGAWIGWAFLEDGGGDLPLRIWIGEDGSATFDGVAWRSFGWPATLEKAGDGQLSLETASPRGTVLQLSGTVTDSLYSGRITVADHAGSFELLPAGAGMLVIDPEHYADIAGYYRLEDGDVLEIRPRSWGEMLLRSLRSGQVRTLLPAAADSFWTGPAMYLPRPVQHEFRILRGTDGAVAGIVQRDAAGRALRGEYFSLRQEEVQCDGEGIVLAGRVTRIADEMPRPGVVILGGSGWRSREDHEFQQRNLAALGFVVLSYDKRGFGESGGEDPVAFETTAADAAAAAGYLRGRDDVGEVGLFGISRGGWIAPLAASLDPQTAFLILFVPPATSPAVQEHDSRIARMRAEGRSEEDITLADEMLTACWRFLADDEQWDSYQALALAAAERGLPEYVLGDSDPDPAVWAWARLNMLYDPIPVLERTRIPLLAVYGENDLSVVTEVQRPAMAAALARAGNASASLVTLPGVGHNLALRRDLPIHRATGQGAEGFDAVMAWIEQGAWLDN